MEKRKRKGERNDSEKAFKGNKKRGMKRESPKKEETKRKDKENPAHKKRRGKRAPRIRDRS